MIPDSVNKRDLEIGTGREEAMESNRKFLISLRDGLQVEAVWYGSGTLCLSSQAGCAMGCPFCASGRHGLRRNLTCEELFLQLDTCRRAGIEPRRLTLSGIGEPLQNLANVSRFITACRGQRLPVSLTTTGMPLTGIAELLSLPHNGVMFSLHAGRAATYQGLLPKGPGLAPLRECLVQCWPHLSGRQRRRLGVNYLLLAGVNDQSAELEALCGWLQPFPELTLHLLFCNPVPGSSFYSPAPDQADHIHTQLRQRGINVRRANRWRQQLEGGCGTLLLGSSLENDKSAHQHQHQA